MKGHQAQSLTVAILWHLLAVILTLSIAGLRFDDLFWKVSSRNITPIYYIVLAYTIGAVILIIYERVKPVSFLTMVIMPLTCLFVAYFYILMADVEVSRIVILLSTLSMVFLFPVHYFLKNIHLLPASINIFISGCVSIALNILVAITDVSIRTAVTAGSESFSVSTAFYDLDVTKFSNLVPPTQSFNTMGAIAHYNGGYVMGTGDGDLYYTSELTKHSNPEIKKMGLKLPMNRDEFMESAGPDFSDYAQYFRLTDIHIEETQDNARFIMGHHFWYKEKGCLVLRISEVNLKPGNLGVPDSPWKTIFETTPCFSPEKDEEWPRSMESGGRLALINDSKLIFTVGDHGFNGYDNDKNYVNDPSASYGKTLLIDTNTGTVENFSIGHRNQQGLLLDEDGKVWTTGHGPQGGDELNLIEKGGHYGWPQETYGTDYGKKIWPLANKQGRHIEFTPPVYSWLSSVGISNLIKIKSTSMFPIWNDDFLIATLKDQALYRMRIKDSRVRFVEKINLANRLRDLLEDNNGRIIAWTDENSLILISAAPQSK